VFARLDSWIVPASIDEESLIYAVIDEENKIDEVHEDNNKAWGLLKNGFNSVTTTEDIIRANVKSNRDKLVQVFPNPMNNHATFSYASEGGDEVEIAIYNFQGQLIKTYPKEYWPAGSNLRTLDISNLDQGIYLYHFKTDGYSETGRMVVLH